MIGREPFEQLVDALFDNDLSRFAAIINAIPQTEIGSFIINTLDEEGNSLLIIAADMSDLEREKFENGPEFVRMLLAHPGININVKNSSGYSALMRAVIND